MHLAAQVDELRARGSRVETILPDSNSRNAFGSNLMDLSTRPPAARAGFHQGGVLAEQLSEFWALTPTKPIDSVGVTTPRRVHRFQDRHQRGTARRGRGHGPVPRCAPGRAMVWTSVAAASQQATCGHRGRKGPALCDSAHSPHRIRPAHRPATQQRSARALEQDQAVFALGRSMSVTPNAATQSPQPVLPIRPARSNTGKFGSAVAKMSP